MIVYLFKFHKIILTEFKMSTYILLYFLYFKYTKLCVPPIRWTQVYQLKRNVAVVDLLE